MKVVLMTAYDVNPYKGSESGTGWNFILQTSRYNKVVAITRKNNESNIKNYIKENRIADKNISFFYFDLPYYLRFWKKGARGAFVYFYLWQLFIPFFILKKRLYFDIAHNVNFHTDGFPTFLWILKKPVIWGPINHNEAVPKTYLRDKRDYFKDRIKWLGKLWMWRLDPLMWLAKRMVTIIICGNSSVVKRMKIKRDKYILMTQIATNYPKRGLRSKEQKQFTVLFIGRLIPIKSVDIAIYAFNDFFRRLNAKDQKVVNFTIVGNGSQYKLIRNLIDKLDARGFINMVGWIEKDNVASFYSHASVFLFPSHEGGGMVLAEALSFGLPIICFDNYGPGEIVNNNCAIKIPYSNFNKSIDDYSKALLTLFYDKTKRYSMSKSSIELFEEKYSWEAKGQAIKKIYDYV